MPILWRELLRQFLKTFTISILAFIAILLITRLEEMARFAALGAPARELTLFALYQLPYILPIAVPLSSLIASLLLFNQLSTSYELVALRSSGFSLPHLLTPLLTVGVFLSFLNFYIVSEVATSAHLTSKQLVQNLTSFNPLVMLHHTQLLKFKDIYIQAEEGSEEVSSDIIVVLHQKKHQRLSLFTARSLTLVGTQIKGNDIALFTNLGGKEQTSFDPLIIENHKETLTEISEFTSLLKETSWRLQNDYLQLPLLLVRREQTQGSEQKAINQENKKTLKRSLNQCDSEIARRISLGIAPIAFILMGCAFGIQINRHRSRTNLISVVILSALSLTAFFLAKGCEQTFWLATSIYFVPHLLIFTASIYTLRRVSQGVS